MSSDHLEEPGETPGPAPVQPAHRRHPEGWHWKLIWTIIGCVILVLLALIVLGVYGAGQKDKAQDAERTLGDLAAEVQDKCTANPTEARKVFGETCGKAKEIDERPPEKKADPVAQGPTESEVRAIVVTELSKNRVSITQAEINQVARVAAGMVPKPKDGKPPAPAQVQGVVSATLMTFCAQDSKPCEGDEGPKGKDAPPITEARLSDAVAAFCGEGAVNCRGGDGKPGTDGTDGTDGQDGRGIKSITKSGEVVTVTYTDDTTATFTVPDGAEGKVGPAGRGIADTDCQEDGDWLITYTDGTTDTARGPCRVVAAPPTDPDPTPAAKKTR
jgi:hypothetical protein